MLSTIIASRTPAPPVTSCIDTRPYDCYERELDIVSFDGQTMAAIDIQRLVRGFLARKQSMNLLIQNVLDQYLLQLQQEGRTRRRRRRRQVVLNNDLIPEDKIIDHDDDVVSFLTVSTDGTASSSSGSCSRKALDEASRLVVVITSPTGTDHADDETERPPHAFFSDYGRINDARRAAAAAATDIQRIARGFIARQHAIEAFVDSLLLENTTTPQEPNPKPPSLVSRPRWHDDESQDDDFIPFLPTLHGKDEEDVQDNDNNHLDDESQSFSSSSASSSCSSSDATSVTIEIFQVNHDMCLPHSKQVVVVAPSSSWRTANETEQQQQQPQLVVKATTTNIPMDVVDTPPSMKTTTTTSPILVGMVIEFYTLTNVEMNKDGWCGEDDRSDDTSCLSNDSYNGGILFLQDGESTHHHHPPRSPSLACSMLRGCLDSFSPSTASSSSAAASSEEEEDDDCTEEKDNDKFSKQEAVGMDTRSFVQTQHEMYHSLFMSLFDSDLQARSRFVRFVHVVMFVSVALRCMAHVI